MGGKSYFSEIIILYDIIKMACVRDFKKFNGIDAQNGYYIKCVNLHKFKAHDFVNFLNDTIFGGKVPFFQRELEKGNEFLQNLHIQACKPRDEDLRSNDVPVFWLSEISGMKTDVGLQIISLADSRLTSRFLKSEGLFTHIIIDSSTSGVDSALDLFLKNDPKAEEAFKVHVNAWNTKEGLGIFFNMGSFEMYLGDSQRNPFIVPPDYPDTERKKLDPDQFILCPMELIAEAKRNPILFVQEKVGLSISSTFKFYSDLNRLGSAFCLPKDYDDILIVDFYDRSDTIMQKVREDVMRLPRDRRLYVRLDCGLSHDLFGIAIGYADGAEREAIDGAVTERLKIKIPILFGLSRYPGQETPLNKVEDFILQIAEDREIAWITSDQYQSSQLRQTFTQNGLEATLRATDRNDSDAVIAKNYIYSGLVDIADNQVAYREMSELERMENGKVDRLRDGVSHKDIADCITGLIGMMVEKGAEEVLAPPESHMQDEVISAYHSLMAHREQRRVAHSYYSDYI